MSWVAHDIRTVAEDRCGNTEVRCRDDTPWPLACYPRRSRRLWSGIGGRLRWRNMALNQRNIRPESQARSHPRRIRQDPRHLSRVTLSTKLVVCPVYNFTELPSS